MSYMWLNFCSGTSYCLEFSTTSNSLCNMQEFKAFGCPLKSICYRFLPFYSITIFQRDFRGQPSAVNSSIAQKKCNPWVMIILHYRSICLSIKDSKIEGVPIKILGWATLMSATQRWWWRRDHGPGNLTTDLPTALTDRPLCLHDLSGQLGLISTDA